MASCLTDQKEAEANPKGPWYTINWKLLPIKLHFLLLSAGVASFQPYLPLHAKQVGLSTTAIGIVYSTVSVEGIILKPFFGWLSDTYRRDKLLSTVLLLFSIIFYLGIAFIPSVAPNSLLFEFNCSANDVQVRELSNICSAGANRTKSCLQKCTGCNNTGFCEDSKHMEQNVTLSFIKTAVAYVNESEVTCQEIPSSECVMTCPCDEWCCANKNEFATLAFWMFIVCFFFVGVSERVLRSLTDFMCFCTLGSNAKDFGKQRLWYTVGICLTPFLTGYLLDATKNVEQYNYAIPAYVLALFFGLDIVSVYLVDLSNREETPKSESIWKDVCTLATKPPLIIFGLTSIVYGMLIGYDNVYYNIFMEEIGASKTLIGISVASCLVTQLPVMYFAGDIVKKLGHFNSFGLSLLLMGVRFLIIAYIKDPLFVLIPQILLRSAREFCIVVITSFAKINALPGTESTLQQITGVLLGGIGIGLGYSLGGLAVDYYGSRYTFIIASVISALTSFTAFAFRKYDSCKKDSGRNWC